MNKLLLLGLVPLTTAAQNSNQAKINVVFILADDMGIGDVGCYGQRTIPTPNIDSLSAHGMQFMQHYSGSTVSAPSRAALLTGKHTGHAAIRCNFVGLREKDGSIKDYPLPKEELTVAEIFKTRGYSTAVVGKWGLGSTTDQGSPLKQGFDYFYGYQTHIDAHRAYPACLWENDTRVELGGKTYADELIVQKGLDFIDRNSTKPFFLYIATTLPHADLLVPEQEIKPWLGKFTEKPYTGGYAAQPTPRAAYGAMITRVDNTVGRVVKQLKALGIYEKTLIIFTSDNGTHSEGGHDPSYFGSNSLYRGTKRDLYEGGIRTPMVACCPNLIGAGSVSYHVGAYWDFLPTICELTGADTPLNTDGISYLPTLKGEGRQKEHQYLYWEFHEQGGKQAVLEGGQWKLIRLGVYKTPHYELYNLARDPKELRSVAVEFPQKVAQLSHVMDSMRTENKVWYFQQ
ncbi:MAG: arylsulfatase [Mucinivorans sp.]